jgi:VanZ family protein
MTDKFVFFMQQPVFRLAYAVIWTALATLLLLQSSVEPVIGPAASPGELTLTGELLMFTGHAVVFTGMTALWWWAFATASPPHRALAITVIAMLAMGTLTEMLQTFSNSRNPSLDDLSVNWLMTIATALFIQLRMQRRQPRPASKP